MLPLQLFQMLYCLLIRLKTVTVLTARIMQDHLLGYLLIVALIASYDLRSVLIIQLEDFLHLQVG